MVGATGGYGLPCHGTVTDRSSKPPLAVSRSVCRNLKNAKYHFIEAKIDKLTESSDTTPNCVSTLTWLCVTSNMKSTSRKTWKTPLYFWNFSKYKTWREKVGGHGILYPTTWKSGGTRPPCAPPNCAHACSYWEFWLWCNEAASSR